MPDWSRIATRLRVPLGFLFAAAYVLFARPTWSSLTASSVVLLAGLLVRAVASGHIRKNAELATTGPYAYVRNPLYLGSILIAIAFLVAARDWRIAIGACAMFAFIYIPVVRAEEKYLSSVFPGYADYCAQVARFWPRLTPYRASSLDSAASGEGSGAGFSAALYRKHREYNALMGSALVMAVLVVKILWM
ncbi:MAG TPA: isoprenylcysteine carboxylmethyltransferase family protein [Candidatus Angelobacter sp.]|nr:isoprenylcysteine carboxylmethyltransferase family protein [Candidatus Angelobacter sp.]